MRQSLSAIVLGSEAIVMFFAALVIFGLKALPPAAALGGGAVLCVLLLANAALLRHRWGYILGWVLQAVIVAACFLVPMLAIAAVVFIGLWVYVQIKGTQIDRDNAQRARDARAAEAAQPASSTEGSE